MSSTRIYLVDLLGSGTDEDPFYPVLENYIGRYTKTRRIFGGEGVMWMMANVQSSHHDDMQADPHMLVMPDLPPGTLVDLIDSDSLAVVMSALVDKSVPTTVITNAVTYGDLIRGIGEYLIGQSWDTTHFFSL